MKLSNITNRKFIESYPANGRKILTPNGYVEILEVHKTIPYRKFRIELENGMILECAYNHVIIKEDLTEVYAKDSLNSMVLTENGASRVINVVDLEIEEHMYDISIDSEDELYYSNGILSHNSGKSITTSIYLSHLYCFRTELNIGIVANKGGMAREFLSNVKNIVIEMPIWMTPGTKSWNKSYIEAENDMRVLTDVPSADAFRGFSIHVAVIDEAGFIRTNVWEEFIDAFLPSQAALSWKKNIILSTPKGMNHFYELVKGASPYYDTEGSGLKDIGDNHNGFRLFKVDWKDVPRYDSSGQLMHPDDFRDAIIAKHKHQYWAQNFECVSGSTIINIFDKEKNEYRDIRIDELKRLLDE